MARETFIFQLQFYLKYEIFPNEELFTQILEIFGSFAIKLDILLNNLLLLSVGDFKINLESFKESSVELEFFKIFDSKSNCKEIIYSAIVIFDACKKLPNSNFWAEDYFKIFEAKHSDSNIILSFFEKAIALNPSDPLVYNEFIETMNLKLFSMIRDYFVLKIKNPKFFTETNEIIQMIQIFLTFLKKSFHRNVLVANIPKNFDFKVLNDLIGFLCAVAVENPKIKNLNELKAIFFFIIQLSPPSPPIFLQENQNICLFTLFKLLEALSFDPEFHFSRLRNEILGIFIENGKLKKKVEAAEFERKFNDQFIKNRTFFNEVFSLICVVKRSKKSDLVIKIKKGNHLKCFSF